MSYTILQDLRNLVNRSVTGKKNRLARQLYILSRYSDYYGNNSHIASVQYEEVISAFLEDFYSDRPLQELEDLRFYARHTKQIDKLIWYRALTRAFRRWVEIELRKQRQAARIHYEQMEKLNMQQAIIMNANLKSHTIQSKAYLEHMMEAIEAAANTPIETDMIRWRLGMLTSKSLCQKYGICRKTLTNRWGKLQDKLKLAIALSEEA